MYLKKFVRVIRRRSEYWLWPLLLLSGMSLWAAMPDGLSTVTLMDPAAEVPCPYSDGSCTYSETEYATAIFEGCTSNAGGEMLVTSTDLDNDGFLDVVMSMSSAYSNKGQVLIAYGDGNGFDSLTDLCNTAGNGQVGSLIELNGTAYNDHFGTGLAIGDVTGDTVPDLIVGAYNYNGLRGAIYILPGGSRWASRDNIEDHPGLIKVTGPTPNELAGFSITVGDFAFDGNEDILIGAPGATGETAGSRAYLIYGPITSSRALSSVGGSYNAVLTGINSSDAGFSVANAGDLDNNLVNATIPDMLIGDPAAGGGQGQVYLVAGRRKSDWESIGSLDLTTAIDDDDVFAVVGDLSEGTSPIGALGYSVAGLGDLNGDGYPDVGMGAPTAPRKAGTAPTYLKSGRIYVIFGDGALFNLGASLTTSLSSIYSFFHGATTEDRLGATITTLGDVDGDDRADFLVGAPDGDAQTGSGGVQYGISYLIPGRKASEWPNTSSGAFISNPPNIAFRGEFDGDHVGIAIHGAQGLDFDGDGIYDFLIGASGYDVSSTNSEGRIYLVGFGDFYDLDQDLQSPAEGDCDDNDSNISYDPTGNSEVCDGIDNDCDGLVDDADNYVADRNTYYLDSDGDGYGNASNSLYACTLPNGYAAQTGDCNDADPAINQGATEICDGKDNDCDGKVDDADSSVSGQNTYYQDQDNDSYGSATSGIGQFCASSAPSGYSASSDDCNDGNYTINPGADEVCDGLDNDCNNLTDDEDGAVLDQNTYYGDADGDGFGTPSSTTKSCASSPPSGLADNSDDCNDNNSDINPDAIEVCDNGIDNNCNDLADSYDSELVGDTLYYSDNDGDTFGTSDGNPTQGCSGFPANGMVENNDDCDDGDSAINPSAAEICDGVDNDCDALIDDADSSISGQNTYYQDNDADGYGDPTGATEQTCGDPSNSFVANNTDCNDTNSTINPGTTEICDDVDNDCDGLTDDADDNVGGQNQYQTDQDNDGFGADDSYVFSCSDSAPTGSSDQAGDCNDNNPLVYPDAIEGQGTSPDFYGCLLPDSVDNDCDGVIDEGTCSSDDDGDGQTEYAGDCDDGDASIHGGSPEEAAPELCDDIDQDCDGNPTNGYDEDGDGYLSRSRCTGTPRGDDCNDYNDAIYPGAEELCDNLDNDCDESVDEDFDVDGDGFLSLTTCDNLALAQDCNDENGLINPDADEMCDPVDHDCVEGAYNGFDGDEDGYPSEALCQNEYGTDCNDDEAYTYPGAPETCDGQDNDCDGSIQDEQDDGDGDSFAVCNFDDPTLQDCDDTRADIYPDAPELCDGVYNNCQNVDWSPNEVPADETDEDGDGYRLCANDCDDGEPITYPGAEEVCDSEDNDCDDSVDEDAIDAEELYEDNDGDGAGDPNAPIWNCTLYDGVVANADDCDDADDTSYLGATEQCDGRDNNCDGTPDTEVLSFDRDGDGFLDANQCQALKDSTALDCDDSEGSINPDATEVRGDGVDNNCDGDLLPADTETTFVDGTLGCRIGTPSSSGSTRAPLWMLLGLGLWLKRRRNQ